MAEPLAERIVAALAADLADGVGDNGATRWYTTKVARASAFVEKDLDASVDEDALYYVIPGQSWTSNHGAYSGVRMSTMEVDIVALRKFKVASENPLKPTEPTRWTEQNRLLFDAEAALYAGTRLPALAIDANVTEKDITPENTFHSEWAVAFLKVVILYQSTRTAP